MLCFVGQRDHANGVDNCAALAKPMFCFHMLFDASDDAPSRKETSHVLVRL